MAGVVLLLVSPPGSRASGVVTTCTEAALRAAMVGGGIVTFACDGTILLARTLTIAASTVLDATGHQVTISGGGGVQVLNVPAGNSLTLIHLTISNGRTSDGTNGMWYYPGYATSGGPGEPGGGIYNADTLTLLDCVVTANRTGNGGLGYSGAYGSGLSSAGGPGGCGGGIYNAGTLTLSNCTVSGNSTGRGGMSGASGPSYIYPVGGVGGFGGGIYNAGTLCLVNSTIQSNSAGNGADNPSKGDGATGGAGGGIWSGGNLTANGCTLSDNSSGTGGTGGNSDLSARAGGAGGPGAAICATGYFALTNCTLVGNSAGPGGAGGSASNQSGFGGSGGQGGSGAGIYCQANSDLVNCSIAANQVGIGGGGGRGGNFGGNGASGSAGLCGGVRAASGTARLLNTIVALNTGNAPDVSGAFLSLGHNLIGATNGAGAFPGPGDLIGSSALPLNPKLGPLANNGGPTLTRALLPGSPAMDAADTLAAPAVDQRGAPRPVGPAADIGAYEYGWPAVLRASHSGGTGVDLLALGNACQSCRLMSSADWSNWVPIATNQIGPNGTYLFHDNCAPGTGGRFYRLVMP
jgi:hypothetical protein